MAQVSETEYKGNPLLVIKNGDQDQFPFQFGIKKAKLILLHIEEIRAFVQKHQK